MYISGTNIYVDLEKYNTSVVPSWIALEKYENCENFYQQMVEKHNKFKLFGKKSK